LIVCEPTPMALVQDTVTGLLPMVGSEAEFDEVLVEATPFTVQVVPAGIELDPSTV
jgi:hypothetical protein